MPHVRLRAAAVLVYLAVAGTIASRGPTEPVTRNDGIAGPVVTVWAAGRHTAGADDAAVVEPPAKRTWIYGGDSSFAPYEYVDQHGQPAGFNIDLVKAMAAEADVRVQFRLGAWRDALAAFGRGEVDLMSIAYSDTRSRDIYWFDRTWTLRQALACRPGRASYPNQLDELAAEIVAVEDRSVIHQLLQELPEVRRPVLVPVASQPEALRLVMDGDATCTAGNTLTLQRASRTRARDVVIIDNVKSVSYHLAVRRGREHELAWIGPAFAAVRESGLFYQLVERHLGERPETRPWTDYLGAVAAAATIIGAILVGVVAWNRSLHRQVMARQAAVERTTRLQAVTAALGEVLAPPDVARVIVEQSVPSLGARAGSVALQSTEDAAVLEVVWANGYAPEVLDQWRRIPLTADVPLAEAVRSGQPVLIEDHDELCARFPSLGLTGQATSAGTTGAWAAIPLAVGGRTLGALGLSFSDARRFTVEDREFLLALARQCAQAIERARLFQGERVARAAAEAASHAKDEFVATLSHELRTPVNAILGWVHLLQCGIVTGDKAERALETVERNARSQMQLIDDLLDLTRVVRGTMQVQVQQTSLESCVRAAVDTIRPTATARGITLRQRIEEGADGFIGDPSRLQQIFWNLLSNAVKFTPAGGLIEVSLTCTHDEAVVRVGDSGIGMDPSLLPHVFDRFYQADTSTTRAHGGLGLGLSIARHLTELHGGRITASSEGRDKGSVFTVRFPRGGLTTGDVGGAAEGDHAPGARSGVRRL